MDEHKLLPSYGSEGDIPDQVQNLFKNEHNEIMEYSEVDLTEVDNLLLRRIKKDITASAKGNEPMYPSSKSNQRLAKIKQHSLGGGGK